MTAFSWLLLFFDLLGNRQRCLDRFRLLIFQLSLKTLQQSLLFRRDYGLESVPLPNDVLILLLFLHGAGRERRCRRWHWLRSFTRHHGPLAVAIVALQRSFLGISHLNAYRSFVFFMIAALLTVAGSTARIRVRSTRRRGRAPFAFLASLLLVFPTIALVLLFFRFFLVFTLFSSNRLAVRFYGLMCLLSSFKPLFLKLWLLLNERLKKDSN